MVQWDQNSPQTNLLVLERGNESRLNDLILSVLLTHKQRAILSPDIRVLPCGKTCPLGQGTGLAAARNLGCRVGVGCGLRWQEKALQTWGSRGLFDVQKPV